jgi:hypothetical protein
LRRALVDQLQLLDRLNAERERGIAAQEREQRLQERAASIVEQQRTPLQRLKDELAELRELWKAGKLDPTQFGRAVGEAERRHQADAGTVTPTPQRAPLGILKFGSSEAHRAIRESQNQDRNKTPEKQLKALEEANKLARETLEVIKAGRSSADVADWS